MNKVRILDVPFSNLTMDETVNALHTRLNSGESRLFHLITANPEIVMAARKDAGLKTILEEADMITPDGIGVVKAAKWFGENIPERVTGCDLLLRLLELGNHEKWSFYFLGADEETSRKAVENIQQKYPGVIIAGRHHGFFKPEDEPRILEDIAKSNPTFLIIALGAPRAEKWIYTHKSSLPVQLAMGVGGSLDIIAGKVKRAPAIWQKLNLEWLHRLLSQPSRWRRQLILPLFVLTCLRERKKHRG